MKAFHKEFFHARSEDWQNKSGHSCPAWGLVALPPHKEPAEGVVSDVEHQWDSVNGLTLYSGYRPTSYSCEAQDANFYAVNHHIATPANAKGQFSRDWPLWALVDSTKQSLIRPGLPCGPIDDSWKLHPAGNAFLCISKAEVHPGLWLAKIMPNGLIARHAIAAKCAAASLAPAGLFFPSGLELLTDEATGGIPAWSRSAFLFRPNAAIGSYGVVRSGVYCGSVAATLSIEEQTSSERSLACGLQINVRRAGSETATPFKLGNTWDGDYGAYNFLRHKAETLHVCLSFMLRLKPGDEVVPRYTGAVDCNLTDGIFIMRAQGGAVWQRSA
jgi:hypothetical protein